MHDAVLQPQACAQINARRVQVTSMLMRTFQYTTHRKKRNGRETFPH